MPRNHRVEDDGGPVSSYVLSHPATTLCSYKAPVVIDSALAAKGTTINTTAGRFHTFRRSRPVGSTTGRG